MANMVGAFFNKAADSSDLFNNLAISKNEDYSIHLNQHNVIYIDFSRMPENCASYHAYISRISNGLKDDLTQIQQIRNKNYALRFQGKLGENPKYTGRILAVGISYNKTTKEHSCKVEILYMPAKNH